MELTLRKLLCAGLLAGLTLAAPVWSQSPMMYQFQSLSESGGWVYGYGETGLLQPADWCQAWPGFCWDQYSSYVQLDLYLDSSSMGGGVSEQYNAPASLSMWSPVDAGQWQLNAYHRVEVVYRSDFWKWPQYAVLSQLAALNHTVYPKISISGAQYINDGAYANFGVTVQRGNPLGYSWSYAAPPGAGNNPSVTFSNPEDELTETDGHWFAYPDGGCTAPPQSSYDITAAVQFSSGSVSGTTDLTIFVPWAPAGETLSPALEDYIWLGLVDGLWRVLPETYFVRLNPLVLIYVPWTSQFHDKTYEHEQVHRGQFMPGGNFHTLEGMRNAANARAAIINLTDSTEQGLRQKVDLALDSFYLNEAVAYALYLEAPAEREAYVVSDNLPPRHVYQNCGRH